MGLLPEEDGQLTAGPSALFTCPPVPSSPSSPNTHTHKGKELELGSSGLSPALWVLAQCAGLETLPSGQTEHPGIPVQLDRHRWTQR